MRHSGRRPNSKDDEVCRCKGHYCSRPHLQPEELADTYVSRVEDALDYLKDNVSRIS